MIEVYVNENSDTKLPNDFMKTIQHNLEENGVLRQLQNLLNFSMKSSFLHKNILDLYASIRNQSAFELFRLRNEKGLCKERFFELDHSTLDVPSQLCNHVSSL